MQWRLLILLYSRQAKANFRVTFRRHFSYSMTLAQVDGQRGAVRVDQAGAVDESLLQSEHCSEGTRMVQRISALDPTESAPVLQMPVVFFIGRHDGVIAPETSVAYLDERESQTSPEHSGNPRCRREQSAARFGCRR